MVKVLFDLCGEEWGCGGELGCLRGEGVLNELVKEDGVVRFIYGRMYFKKG